MNQAFSNIPPGVTLLERCKNSFKQIRVNLIEATEALYRIKSEELWRNDSAFESYTFGQYCEEELQISQSFASKLLSNWNTYVLEGRIDKQLIVGVDYEKLYLAQRLPFDNAIDKLQRAQDWSRSEIKAELAEKNGEPCPHTETIHICAKCHQRV